MFNSIAPSGASKVRFPYPPPPCAGENTSLPLNLLYNAIPPAIAAAAAPNAKIGPIIGIPATALAAFKAHLPTSTNIPGRDFSLVNTDAFPTAPSAAAVLNFADALNCSVASDILSLTAPKAF